MLKVKVGSFLGGINPLQSSGRIKEIVCLLYWQRYVTWFMTGPCIPGQVWHLCVYQSSLWPHNNVCSPLLNEMTMFVVDLNICTFVIRGLCSDTPIRSVWSHPHPDKAQLTYSLQVKCRCEELGDLLWPPTRFFAPIDNSDEKSSAFLRGSISWM